MAQLVHLIVADDLDVQQILEVFHVGLADRAAGDARPGEGDLAGGGKLIHHVGVAVLRAQGQNVREGHEIPLQLVDAVGIVPHEHKVRRGGLHGGQPVDGLKGIGNARGVGVFGHVPHAPDLRVPDQALHFVHVRAGLRHPHRDQLHAEGLRHLEVPVIARHRAQPLHPVQLAPGLLAVQQAVGIRLGHGVEHHLQGGVAPGDDLAGLAAQKVCKQLPGNGNTRHIAVISRINAVGDEVVGSQGDVVHLHDHIQLLPAGLAPGHVQLQSQGLLLLVGPAQGGVFRLPLRKGHFLISFHDAFPLFP